jgi:hypothetical protein
MNESLSPELMAKAVALRSDFIYYAPRCLKVKSKAGQIVPFTLNRSQLYLHELIEDQIARLGRVRVIVLKGRQQGISTYVEGRFYWKTSMNRGKRAYILTHLQEATDNLFAMTQRYHEHCPSPLKPHTKNQSAKALTFDNLDSEFSVATAGSKGTGRSGTGQYMHGSEVGFWDNAADHMAGIGQTIPEEAGTEIILESTGNGIGNEFHKRWQDAVRGKSDYLAVFIPWFWEPGYRSAPPDDWRPTFDEEEYAELYGLDLNQLYWRRKKIDGDFGGEESYFDQEYPATAEMAFRRQLGNTLFSLARIEKAMAVEELDAVGPKIMGIDPAESEKESADDTVMVLRQGRVVHEVLRFHGRSTMEIVGLAAKAIARWQPDYINVDAGGLGSGVADRLIELGHPVSRILFGERAFEQDLYGLRRDEMWGEMYEWFKDVVKLPNNEPMKADLATPIKDEDSSLRFKLESKKAMKKRGLSSPDAGDALALTFALPAVGVPVKKVSRAQPSNWRVL